MNLINPQNPIVPCVHDVEFALFPRDAVGVVELHFAVHTSSRLCEIHVNRGGFDGIVVSAFSCLFMVSRVESENPTQIKGFLVHVGS